MRPLSRPPLPPRSLLVRAATIALAAGVLCAGPSVARADDAAAAQALFDEAMALKNQESWDKACPKFESSYKLDPALGTLLNLANCFEKIGKTASAWARWEEAYQWAIKNEDDRAEYAKTQRDALVPKLAKLKIVVTNPVPALSIERDTTKMSSATHNVGLPVDPGEHTVFVKRDDEVLKTEKVKVVEAQSVEIAFDLAAIEKAAPPPKPKKDVIVVGTSPALRKAGWGIGGAGVGIVAIAAALEGLAASRKSEADSGSNCVNKVCSTSGLKVAEDAKTLAEAGQWVGIGGLVVTAVGVTLLIVSPSQNVVKDKDKTPEKAAPAKEGKLPGGLWATPWIAPERAGSRDGTGVAGGLVIGGSL